MVMVELGKKELRKQRMRNSDLWKAVVESVLKQMVSKLNPTAGAVFPVAETPSCFAVTDP